MAAEKKSKHARQHRRSPSVYDLSFPQDMERWMERYFGRGWAGPWGREWPVWGWPEIGGLQRTSFVRLPRVDVIERDNEIVVNAELPGVEKKDLDVSLAGDSVVIKGHARHEEKEEKAGYHRSEISRGEFARTISLPAAVDGDKAKASFKDGMLELVLPKVEASKRRTVAID